MSDNQTLEVAPSVTQEPSEPIADVNAQVEEGATKPVEEVKPEEGKAENAEPTEVEKVKLAMQKRIDRQTAAFKASQERMRQLEEQVKAFEAKAPQVDNAPKQEDFATYEEWEEAITDYKAEKKAEERIRTEKEKELQAAKERQAAEVRREFEQKESAFRTQAHDYDLIAGEAVAAMNELALSGQNIVPLRDAVMQFDNPPAMIYELGKDPELIQSLVSMEPLKAMRELVKLEIAMESKAMSVPPKAPEPIRPLGGKGGVKPLHERSGKDVLDWARKR